MKRIVLAALGVLTIAIAQPAPVRAEIYMGIRPFDTLGDIKKLFPSGTFKDLKPAWATPSDRLIGVTGSGISGEIIVLFYDSRPSDLEFLAKNPDSVLRDSITKNSQKSDEDALEVVWVRWSPDAPGIPIARLVSKYGPAFQKGYSDDNFRPFRNWKALGVDAYLDDKEKLVIRVDFTFTPAEYCAASKAKKQGALLVEHHCKKVK